MAFFILIYFDIIYSPTLIWPTPSSLNFLVCGIYTPNTCHLLCLPFPRFFLSWFYIVPYKQVNVAIKFKNIQFMLQYPLSCLKMAGLQNIEYLYAHYFHIFFFNNKFDEIKILCNEWHTNDWHETILFIHGEKHFGSKK